MKTIFILQHTYELEEHEVTKLIGAYSSKQEAQKAIERLSKQKGFRDHLDGFVIAAHEIDKDHWVNGFATMTSIQTKAVTGNYKTVTAEVLPNNEFLIVEKYDNDKLGEFKDGDIVRCREEAGDFFAVEKIRPEKKQRKNNS